MERSGITEIGSGLGKPYGEKICFRLDLMNLTAEWLELLSPVPGVEGSNPAISGVITEKVLLAAEFIQSTLWHG